MRRTDIAFLILGVILFLTSFVVNPSVTHLSLPPFSFPVLSLPQIDLSFPGARETAYLPEPVALSPMPTQRPKSGIYPTKLVVPKLGIESDVETVGRTQTGNMDVPKDAADVAWFEEGPTPSVRGNAVITGHYDTPSGRPAIFYHLNRLAKGDAVIVVLSDGSRHEFVVTGKDLIPYDVFPSEYVFATKYGTNLNLITCNGIWDREDKIYDKRLVIYATLKGTQFNTF